jgi:hypothetical protein
VLTATGIIALTEDPKETPAKGGVYFNFLAIAADNLQGSGKYHHYSVSVYIPETNLEEARKKLQAKKVINIHSGYWSAAKIPGKEGKEFVANQLSTTWRGIAVLGWFQSRTKD